MSGGKGGGGDGGAGAMVQYGDKALKLQKEIYEENKDFIKPYYQAGNLGLNELMRRMGLGGAGIGMNKTEAQLRTELAPTYTTSKGGTSGSYGDFYAAISNSPAFKNTGTGQNRIFSPQEVNNMWRLYQKDPEEYGKMYKIADKVGSRSSSVDASGLDAAVQRALAEQAARNASAQNSEGYGSLLKRFGMDDYQADPGYQFRLSEGNKALERALAAKGQFSSMNPAAAKALQDFGQQSASQEYGAAYDRYNIDQGNIFNRLAAVTGIGQTATGQLTGQGNQLANSATDILTGQGNALAAAAQQRQANRGSMFSSLLGLGGNVLGAGIQAGWFSDINLKENIKHVGYENGHKIYEFNYKTDPDIRFIGVMAQDVEKTHPEAVTEIEGFKAVNYDYIGVKMREVH